MNTEHNKVAAKLFSFILKDKALQFAGDFESLVKITMEDTEFVKSLAQIMATTNVKDLKDVARNARPVRFNVDGSMKRWPGRPTGISQPYTAILPSNDEPGPSAGVNEDSQDEVEIDVENVELDAD
jgi:hypothetical protein